jgi:hypothetical protein
MKMFEVALSERLIGVVAVEAGSKGEARQKVRKMIRGVGEEDIPDGVMNDTKGYVIEGVREVAPSCYGLY